MTTEATKTQGKNGCKAALYGNVEIIAPTVRGP
jgi:hypothetical protein